MKRIPLVLLLAGSLSVLMSGPAQAQDFGDDFGDGFVLGVITLIAVPTTIGLTMNILAIAAEANRDTRGYMKPGWIAMQYIAGALDVGAGAFTAIILTDNNSGQDAAIAALPFAVGALWLGLASFHVVHNNKVGKLPKRPGYGPYVAPTRDGGLIAGWSFRF